MKLSLEQNYSFPSFSLSLSHSHLEIDRASSKYINFTENELSNDCLTMADTPIDLSRRCDSVETRKTPSPYSSAFGESPPNLLNDSPTSSHSSSTMHHRRSDTPPNHYNNNHNNSIEYMRSQFTSQANPTKFAFQPKIEPELTPEQYHIQNQLMQTAIEHNPFIQLELKQKILDIPNKVSTVAAALAKTQTVLESNSKQSSRPFKAYQENTFFSDFLMDENYSHFRDQTLDAIRQRNGGQLTVSNPRMSRVRKTASEDSTNSQNDAIESKNSPGNGGSIKDSTYYERRRKNNEAAKKSRDRRRHKEDELALRTAFLEQENMMLKVQLATVKKQLEHFVANQRKSS